MRILLAIDGSTQSTDAVQAIAHFRPSEELTLVHALVLPDLDHPMITPDVRDQVVKGIEEKLREKGEALLEQAVSALAPDSGPVQCIHQIGSPAHVILETVKSAQPDLIILGARGLGSIKELVLGSVSHRVLSHTPCSTLVMKSPLPKLSKVLLPVEGMEDAEIALKFLAKNPFRNPIEVEVMTVWPQPQTPWPITLGHTKLMEERALEHARERLDALTARLVSMNYHGKASVGLGDPAYAILEQAQASKSDLILIGSHGKRGLTRFFLGSVSHAVLQRASCPVLVVR